MDIPREQIVADAREHFRHHYPEIRERAACLFLAISTIMVAQDHGLHLVLQAGTTFWRRVPDALDDGKVSTHFGYEFTWNYLTQSRVQQGILPEMHVWAGDPKRQELIDLTTRYLPEQCQALTRTKWLMGTPPDHIWKPVREVEDYYEPSREATEVAAYLFDRYRKEHR